MGISRSTEENKSEKSYVHCPRCDKTICQAVEIIDGIFKCEKCHRRYLINIANGSVSISLLNKPKEDETI